MPSNFVHIQLFCCSMQTLHACCAYRWARSAIAHPIRLSKQHFICFLCMSAEAYTSHSLH